MGSEGYYLERLGMYDETDNPRYRICFGCLKTKARVVRRLDEGGIGVDALICANTECIYGTNLAVVVGWERA